MTDAVTTRRRHCKNIYPHETHAWLVVKTALEWKPSTTPVQINTDEVVEYDTFICPGVVRA